MLYILAFTIGIAVGSSAARQIVRQYWIKELRKDRQEHIAQHAQMLDESAQELHSAEEARGQLETQLRECLQQRNRLQLRSEQLTEEVQSYAEKIQTLERQLATGKARFETAIASYQREHNKLSSENENIQTSMRSANVRYENLRQETTQWQDAANECEGLLESEKKQHLKLQKAYSTHRADNDAAIELRREGEVRTAKISRERDRLKEKVKKLKKSIVQLEDKHEKEIQAILKEPSLDLVKVVEKVFPNMKLLHNSASELKRRKKNLGDILLSLKRLENNDALSHIKKLHETNYDVWEYRVAGQGRIYYHLSDGGSTPYKVVIAWKYNPQKQRQVIQWLDNWLKRHYSRHN